MVSVLGSQFAVLGSLLDAGSKMRDARFSPET